MTDRPGMAVGPDTHTIEGKMLHVGDAAPAFELVPLDVNARRTLADYADKVKIVSCVPSLDTPVCATQTRVFNKEVDALGDDIVILTLSADTPFAQGRWCGLEDNLKLETLSTYRDTPGFARPYGVYDADWHTLQRAVFVLDRDNTVRYAEYVDDIGAQPDHDAALEVARGLVS